MIAISDTHLTIPLPVLLKDRKDDLLVIAGDVLNSGSVNDWGRFTVQLEAVRDQFTDIIVVLGNHDIFGERYSFLARESLEKIKVTLLTDQYIELQGLKIYGSPYTPLFGPWAFMKPRGKEMRKVWKSIPEELDLLVTHGPPKGILDSIRGGLEVGCEELRNKIDTMESPPKIMIFGHIHHSYGSIEYTTPRGKNIKLYNVAICNESYTPTNQVTKI